MKNLKKTPFLALLFLFLSIGFNSSLLAQINYSLEFDVAADCDNATVDVFLVHDAPTPTVTTGGVSYLYVAGNISFNYDHTILSNPVLTDHNYWGNGFLSSTPAAADYLVFNFNPGDLVEYQFQQRVRVFTITFDHSSSLECVELSFRENGTFAGNFLYTSNNEELVEDDLEIEDLCIPSCPFNRLAAGTNNTENSIPNTIKAYPNPAEGSDINLSLNKTIEGEREISVIDITGKVLFSQKYSGEMLRIQLPSSQWSPGVYIISSTSKSEKITTKLTIK